MGETLHIRDDTNDRGDRADYAPDIQRITDLIDWRPKAWKFLTNYQSPFESLSNPSSSIHEDAVINDSGDEPVMVKDDRDRRPGEIEFTLEQSFYNRRHFRDTLKEFSIVKNLTSNILRRKTAGQDQMSI